MPKRIVIHDFVHPEDTTSLMEFFDENDHLCGDGRDFHKDKTYRDPEWAEKVNELNYFVPLTKAYGTNTLWAETEEDKGDYIPFESDYGECIEWFGSHLTHGNKINKTSMTRVSFDFRVIPKSRYFPSKHTSVNMKIPFAIGGFYGGIIWIK